MNFVISYDDLGAVGLHLFGNLIWKIGESVLSSKVSMIAFNLKLAVLGNYKVLVCFN